jgi:hypothetical protein
MATKDLIIDGLVVATIDFPDSMSDAEMNARIASMVPYEPTLAELIQVELKKFDKDTTEYIYSHYPAPSQQSLVAELVDAALTGKNNKLAMIMAVKVWVTEVLTYHWGKWAEIEATQDKESLEQISWDLEQFNATDPNIGLKEVSEAID